MFVDKFQFGLVEKFLTGASFLSLCSKEEFPIKVASKERLTA